MNYEIKSLSEIETKFFATLIHISKTGGNPKEK